MREMGLFWETIKHLFSTILQVLWAAVYRQIQQTWEGTHEQLRYCLNFQIYTSRIKGRATNFWCFLGRAILFREKTGRATNICPKTWTGDKKNLVDGRSEVSPVLLYGGCTPTGIHFYQFDQTFCNVYTCILQLYFVAIFVRQFWRARNFPTTLSYFFILRNLTYFLANQTQGICIRYSTASWLTKVDFRNSNHSGRSGLETGWILGNRAELRRPKGNSSKVQKNEIIQL